jgi:chaperone required for assembly of F1-ATPase
MVKPGAKRFYKAVDVREEPDGFAILLDGRAIKTPAGSPLRAPARALAEAIAAEWRAQGETLAPETMPLTKSLNTALDRIASNRAAVVEDLAKYAAERFAARLAVTTGVSPVAQPKEALARLKDAVAAHDHHQLVALHAGVTITGSAILGLAFAAKALTAEEAFAAAQIDETYQAELWGNDAEAEKTRANRLAELKAAEAYLKLVTKA